MDGGDTCAAPCTIGEDEYDLGIATVVGEEDLSRAIDRGGDDMIHRLRNQEDK